MVDTNTHIDEIKRTRDELRALIHVIRYPFFTHIERTHASLILSALRNIKHDEDPWPLIDDAHMLIIMLRKRMFKRTSNNPTTRFSIRNGKKILSNEFVDVASFLN